jgi:hypothetical protein
MIGHSTVLIEAAGKHILIDRDFSLHGNPAYAAPRPPARSQEEDCLKNGKLFLRQAKTKHSGWVPPPSKVVKALKACDEGENAYYSCAWY